MSSFLPDEIPTFEEQGMALITEIYERKTEITFDDIWHVVTELIPACDVVQNRHAAPIDRLKAVSILRACVFAIAAKFLRNRQDLTKELAILKLAKIIGEGNRFNPFRD